MECVHATASSACVRVGIVQLTFAISREYLVLPRHAYLQARTHIGVCLEPYEAPHVSTKTFEQAKELALDAMREQRSNCSQ